jgi:hypothetical protein
MGIGNLLVNSLKGRLLDEYRDLDRQINGNPSEEVSRLKSFIRKKIQVIEGLDTPVQNDSHAVFRQLKLELRFAQRSWQRQRLNELRFKKSQTEKDLTTSYAA